MRVLLYAIAGAAVLTAACSSETVEPAALEDPAEFASERFDAGEAPSPADDSSADPRQEAPVAARIRGSVIDQFSLSVGDCFNRLENLVAGRSTAITSLIDCDLPHDHQIYHVLDYPAPHPSIYPGEKVMDSFAVQSCYREFAAWVGNDYETSELDIGVITPPRDDFEDDASRYRSIHCFLERFDGEPLVGDTRQSGW